MDILIEQEFPATRKDAGSGFKPFFKYRRSRGWVVLALLAVPVVVLANAVRPVSEEEFGYDLVDVCGFGYCVAALYWVLHRWYTSSYYARRFLQSRTPVTAFMYFTDSHLRYGTRGKVEIAIAWDLLEERGFRRSGFRLEADDMHLFVKRCAFTEQQIEELAGFLQEKKTGRPPE